MHVFLIILGVILALIVAGAIALVTAISRDYESGNNPFQ